jgi:hypothetical protein
MSLTYTSYAAQLQNLVSETTPTPGIDFTNILPGAIDYAVQHLYRELDLLSTVTRDSSVIQSAAQAERAWPTSLRFSAPQGLQACISG